MEGENSGFSDYSGIVQRLVRGDLAPEISVRFGVSERSFRYNCEMKKEHNSNRRKKEQLGMAGGTASNRLRKMVMFSILKKHNENTCYRCNEEIATSDELSVEHKEPWLDSDNPIEKFFDLENIAFSHLSCNVGSGRRRQSDHGKQNRYDAGCRCDLCKETMKLIRRKQREKKTEYGGIVVAVT